MAQAIDKSIKNLNTLDKEYKNRIILILSDGQNNYNITEPINNKIIIYTMEIGGNSNKNNLILSQLSKKNHGKAYFYNQNTDEIEKVYSKIKKYFKCKKLLPVGLFSIFFMFILPIILTFFYKGCENEFKIDSMLTGCKSDSSRRYDMLQACTSTQYNSPKGVEKNIQKDSNITSCEPKKNNGFKCHLISNKSVQANIYDLYPRKKIITLINFASGKNKIKNEYKIFLEEVLDRSNIQDTIQEVKIVGHTDLERVKSGKPYYLNQDCQNSNKKTNECLGKERAFQVEQILRQSHFKFINIISKYDNDFFLGSINKELNYTLLKRLNLDQKIDKLIKKLDSTVLSSKYYYNIKEVREDSKIQKEIIDKNIWYRKEFTPFRSVVIIIDTGK